MLRNLRRMGLRHPSLLFTRAGQQMLRQDPFFAEFEQMSKEMDEVLEDLFKERFRDRPALTDKKRNLESKQDGMDLEKDTDFKHSKGLTNPETKEQGAKQSMETEGPASDKVAESSALANNQGRDIIADELTFPNWDARMHQLDDLKVEEDDKNYTYRIKNISDPKNVKVVIKDRIVNIEGKTEKKTENGFYSSSFSRTFTVPENVDDDAIKATFTDGTLTVNAPKKDMDTREIPIEK